MIRVSAARALAVAALGVAVFGATVFGTAAPARADLVTASSITDIALGGSYTTANTATDVASINDVSFGITYNSGTNVRAFSIAPPFPSQNERSVFFYLGAGSANVTLTGVRYHTGAYVVNSADATAQGNAGTGANSSAIFAPIVLTQGKNFIQFNNYQDNNGFVGDAYTTVTYYVQFTGGAGSNIQFDYIANPEPGTMALMGLGLLGLGGVVVRRRNQKKAKTA